MDRSQQAALVAAREAWADAGAPEVDKERLGAVVASGIGGVTSLLAAYDTLRERGPSRVSPHMVTMLMANGSAAVVGLEVGARAGVHTPVSACASGAEAISLRGPHDPDRPRRRRHRRRHRGLHPPDHDGRLLRDAGAVDAQRRPDGGLAPLRHRAATASSWARAPASSSSRAPSTPPPAAPGSTASYAGSGLTSDGHHIAQPDPEGTGAARAITLALEDAGLTPADIVHVNAHATSTPQGDIAEATAIRLALGADADHAVVTGTKSMTGHLLGGAGAVESIFTILALRDRLVPPTANLVDLDPEIDPRHRRRHRRAPCPPATSPP